MSAVGEPVRPTRLGRYELITRIGQGGMAEVQLALQRGPAGFEKLVVVKLVHDSLASQKAFVDMLLDEARVAALVKHPNVVDIYDLGQADGRFFIAMEYLEGEPLLAVLRAGREGKRLDPLSTGRMIADTAEGLDAAHELRSMSGERLELVHHDISLGNIVVLYSGQVKLVDFGVAKATQAGGPNNKVQGKFSYMAPEKLHGAAGDRRSDIFSLGCVMWEALTLKRLFRGGNDGETMKQVLEMAIKPPSKVNPEVPAEYDAIVMRALDREPSRRHRTAKELAVEIEELLRKRGYGAKNDRIARYMQDTFKNHIDARKKLVQEVVSKGSASAEVLDAAFSDPVLAQGSPLTPLTPTPAPANELSMKHRRPMPNAVPVPTAAWADASKETQITAPPAFEPHDPDEDAATTVARSAPDAEPARASGGAGTTKTSLPPPSKPGLPPPHVKPTLPRPKPPSVAGAKPELAPIATPAPAPSATPTPAPGAPAPEPYAPATRAPTATEIDAAPLGEADHVANGVAAPAPVPAFDDGTTVAGPTLGAAARVKAVLTDKKQRIYVIGAAAAVLLLVIAIAMRGGKETKPTAASTGSDVVAKGAGSDQPDDVEQPRPNHGETTGAGSNAGSGEGSDDNGGDRQAGSGSEPASGSGSDLGSGSGSDSGATENPSGTSDTGSGAASSDKKPDRGDKPDRGGKPGGGNNNRPPPPPPIDVEATVQKGLMAFVKGDSRGALALLQKAKAAKPGYAPTYRVLGKVHKKLGDHDAAKRAFQRYLALSPNAADAHQIREEIKKL